MAHRISVYESNLEEKITGADRLTGLPTRKELTNPTWLPPSGGYGNE